jgi:hypothetical protein
VTAIDRPAATIDAGDAPSAAAMADAPAALPVALDLVGRHADAVRAWVEGVLGWQSVDAATGELVPPAVRLLDHDGPPSGVRGPSVPTVLVVDDEATAVRAARLVHAVGPDLVLAWPSGRDELPTSVGALVARPRARVGALRELRVGGAAGGVGTTTVTLALAGLLGWSGCATLAVVRAPAPVRDLPLVPAEALGAAELWGRAATLPGVPAGRVLGIAGGSVPPPADPQVEAVVIDAGVDDDVEVLVCRPDAAGMARLASTTAAAVVLVGDGPAPTAELARAAGGRRGIRLPWSARVARAALHGRVPSALPGRFLRRLLPVVVQRGDP